MDFIERLFGLSTDNGDGSTEILWLVARGRRRRVRLCPEASAVFVSLGARVKPRGCR